MSNILYDTKQAGHGKLVDAILCTVRWRRKHPHTHNNTHTHSKHNPNEQKQPEGVTITTRNAKQKKNGARIAFSLKREKNHTNSIRRHDSPLWSNKHFIRHIFAAFTHFKTHTKYARESEIECEDHEMYEFVKEIEFCAPAKKKINKKKKYIEKMHATTAIHNTQKSKIFRIVMYT